MLGEDDEAHYHLHDLRIIIITIMVIDCQIINGIAACKTPIISMRENLKL